MDACCWLLVTNTAEKARRKKIPVHRNPSWCHIVPVPAKFIFAAFSCTLRNAFSYAEDCQHTSTLLQGIPAAPLSNLTLTSPSTIAITPILRADTPVYEGRAITRCWERVPRTSCLDRPCCSTANGNSSRSRSRYSSPLSDGGVQGVNWTCRDLVSQGMYALYSTDRVARIVCGRM